MQVYLRNRDLWLAELPADHNLRQLLVSSPESRAICNDPLVLGVKYTKLLQRACAKALFALSAQGIVSLAEQNCVVLNILRGGLNFGLRDALADGLGWNIHRSSFLSAQRQGAGNEWFITERSYKKLELPKQAQVVFGDVVATGSSLRYALSELRSHAERTGESIKSCLFFTIGGEQSYLALREYADLFEEIYIIYLEGVFAVPSASTGLRIQIEGTDLLRRDSILADPFAESQYDNPAYPLERCTIYDAGSRAFSVHEYLDDVIHYWTQVQTLANQGVDYTQYLLERYPSADREKFNRVDLNTVAIGQLEKLRSVFLVEAGKR